MIRGPTLFQLIIKNYGVLTFKHGHWYSGNDHHLFVFRNGDHCFNRCC